MAATFGDIIEEVTALLSGYGLVRNRVATLTSAGGITSSATSLTVDDATTVDAGVVEIDQELMYVSSTDEPTKVATIPPWGRGYGGSLAVEHALNARINVNPRFPRFRVATVINEEIRALYPDLFGVADDETQTVLSVRVGYPVPIEAESIMSIGYKQIGPNLNWPAVQRYSFDPSANLTDFPTGKAVYITQLMQPGRTLSIQYRTRLVPMAAETDLLTSTGLAESARDLVVMGAVYRLLLSVDPARMQTASIEANHNRDSVPLGTPQGIARNLLQMHEVRKAQERKILLQQYPLTTTNRF